MFVAAVVDVDATAAKAVSVDKALAVVHAFDGAVVEAASVDVVGDMVSYATAMLPVVVDHGRIQSEIRAGSRYCPERWSNQGDKACRNSCPGISVS